MDVSGLLESDFVSASLVSDALDKTAVIVNSGVPEKGEFGTGCKLTVRFNNKEKFYKPNKTSLKNLAAKWGPETSNWVNKKILFQLALLQGGKQGIVASPVEQ